MATLNALKGTIERFNETLDALLFLFKDKQFDRTEPVRLAEVVVPEEPAHIVYSYTDPDHIVQRNVTIAYSMPGSPCVPEGGVPALLVRVHHVSISGAVERVLKRLELKPDVRDYYDRVSTVDIKADLADPFNEEESGNWLVGER